MLGLAFTFLLGLLIGGTLGGFAIALFQQIRTGRIKLPPTVSLGPVKMDISALSPQPGQTAQESDLSSMKPLIEGGGSATGGCLSFIGAGMVLIGFVLPWFTCNIASLISGSFSGLTVLMQLVFAVFISLAGLAGSASQYGEYGAASSAMSGAIVILVALVTLFVALTPLAGLSIGRSGLRLMQSLKETADQRKRAAQGLSRVAVIGFLPLLCYFTSATANINLSGLGALGLPIEVKSADIGLWLTMAGFGVAFVGAIVISTAVSLSEGLTNPSAKDEKK
ncbi:MAG: hypothetical protein FJ030_18190 [Chloroflexi bacterium]|nr:hypothetical protein [Chloroflexota bacterium]